MIKQEELTSPDSCMSRARDDEWTFVLLGRDITSPGTIRDWAMRRIRYGKNKIDDPQITEALEAAKAIERELYPFAVDSPEYTALNRRRTELLQRDAATWNNEEVLEYRRLSLACQAVSGRAFPPLHVEAA